MRQGDFGYCLWPRGTPHLASQTGHFKGDAIQLKVNSQVNQAANLNQVI